MKLASCKSALTTTPAPGGLLYSIDRSKAVVPVLVLLFVALWFILRGDLFYVLPCVILFLCFFSPFSIAITSLGGERANRSAFRTLVDLCLFVTSSSWCLGRAAVCDCGTPWTILLPFYVSRQCKIQISANIKCISFIQGIHKHTCTLLFWTTSQVCSIYLLW